jgi:hypothetical protein
MNNLESRLKALEVSTPEGVVLYDQAGGEVLASDLPLLQWYLRCKELLSDPSRAAEAETLRGQLQMAVRSRSGDRMFELLRALYAGPVKQDSSETTCREGSQA